MTCDGCKQGLTLIHGIHRDGSGTAVAACSDRRSFWEETRALERVRDEAAAVVKHCNERLAEIAEKRQQLIEAVAGTLWPERK